MRFLKAEFTTRGAFLLHLAPDGPAEAARLGAWSTSRGFDYDPAKTDCLVVDISNVLAVSVPVGAHKKKGGG